MLHMIFQEKYFSCYILLTDQISLSDCIYFSRYWTICASQLFVNHTGIIKIEINFIFLIKPLWYMTKSQDKNLNILRTKRFWAKIKNIFQHFSSVAKNCLRPESVPLSFNTKLGKNDNSLILEHFLLISPCNNIVLPPYLIFLNFLLHKRGMSSKMVVMGMGNVDF